jgi:hypothetical protein
MGALWIGVATEKLAVRFECYLMFLDMTAIERIGAL